MHTSANGTHGFFTTFSLVTRQQDLPPQAGETSQHGGEAFFLVAFWYVCKDTMNRTWHIGEVVRRLGGKLEVGITHFKPTQSMRIR